MSGEAEATLKTGVRSEAERLRFLVRASRELALLKRDALGRRARDLLISAGSFSELSLWVLDPRSELLYPWTLSNTPVVGRRPRLQVGQGLAGQACAEEEPVYRAELPPALYLADEWGGRPASLIQGVLTLPLRRGGEPLGVAVLHKLDREPPPEDEIQFLREIGAQLAI